MVHRVHGICGSVIQVRLSQWFCKVEYSPQTVQCFSSPLTANIYLPAIPTIAAAFNKSTELINLTVTVYMVLQGICKLHRPL